MYFISLAPKLSAKPGSDIKSVQLNGFVLVSSDSLHQLCWECAVAHVDRHKPKPVAGVRWSEPSARHRESCFKVLSTMRVTL